MGNHVLLVYLATTCDKKHSNVDGDVIMHKLPTVLAVRAA